MLNVTELKSPVDILYCACLDAGKTQRREMKPLPKHSTIVIFDIRALSSECPDVKNYK